MGGHHHVTPGYFGRVRTLLRRGRTDRNESEDSYVSDARSVELPVSKRRCSEAHPAGPAVHVNSEVEIFEVQALDTLEPCRSVDSSDLAVAAFQYPVLSLPPTWK